MTQRPLAAPMERTSPAAPATDTADDVGGTCRGIRATCTLARSLRAPSEARAFVEKHTCPWPNGATPVAVTHVLGEIVGEVLLAARGPISITAECDGRTLRLSATGWRAPDSRPAERLSDKRLVRTIVDGTCRAYGAEDTDQGFTLWCIVPTSCARNAGAPDRPPDRGARRAAQGTARRDSPPPPVATPRAARTGD